MSADVTTTRSAAAVHFATTAWSNVLRARSVDVGVARPALGELCAAYWYPLYAYARRRGLSPVEAEDAVQSFFLRLIDRELLSNADPARRRFRGFLAASFCQYLAKRHDFETAQKRSPGTPIASIDSVAGEVRYATLAINESPDAQFDRDWALAVVEQARQALAAEHASPDKRERFEVLSGTLTGQLTASAAELGKRLKMREGAVRVAIQRLRQRYGELLRAEVAATLDEGESVDDELINLMTALESQ